MNETTIPVDVKATGTVTRFASTLKQCVKCGYAGEPKVMIAKALTVIQCPVCEHFTDGVTSATARARWNVPPA